MLGNYGDEGKGLVTCALCHQSFSNNEKVLNVLTNGGCQRGHTAYDQYGHRHVYSHLGSGYPYADLIFSKFYLVNPMVFCEELYGYHSSSNRIFIDPECTLTTPWDMLVNRMLEDNRSKNRHGSCGYGIWESIQRNQKFPLYWKDLYKPEDELLDIFRHLRDEYFTDRINEYGLTMDEDQKSIFYSDIMVHNYVNDLRLMQQNVEEADIKDLIRDYDTVVFENAQGLLLDMDVNKFGTPSKTGMAYITQILPDEEITPYYVTRTYLTKHGNGDFPEECEKSEINSHMFDITNHPNPYQGVLRYGKFTQQGIKDLITRIKTDAGPHQYKLVVTHCNEYIEPELIKYADYVSYDEFDIVDQQSVD